MLLKMHQFCMAQHEFNSDIGISEWHYNICGMYCTGFHSHNASLTGSCPWCGCACLAGHPPTPLLRELCHPLSPCAGNRTLRPSVHSNLVIPLACSAAMQTRSFSVVGPATWNELPIDLRHLPDGACSQVHHLLKTVLFRLAWVGSPSV